MKKPLLFVLLLLSIVQYTSAQVQTAGSYLNKSRPGGGPIALTDTLEIRAVIAVPAGTTITLVRFTDNVPTGTTYINNSLKALTNEGVVVGAISNTGNYTDASGDDKGRYVSGSGAITVYIGDGAVSGTGGTINGSTTMPRHYNNACIIMIAYRVKVNVATGSSISINGRFNYTAGSAQTVNLPANILRVAAIGGCALSTNINVMSAETNGTFSSGVPSNRAASGNVTGFTYRNLNSGSPADGEYSITKNTSPTQFTGGSPNASDKVFNVWDIFGDHTGTSNGIGNVASANGISGGYMAVVNASYAPAAVFNVPISGLLANSAYTLSFWVRNLCGTCGNNPTSNSGSGTPGVKPNLAFELDGIDLYSTGELVYMGQWVQKSFTFYSGALTSFTLTIKNNAPGGGGNDWAIDDIRLSECSIVLAAKIESFVAAKKGNEVLLQWATFGQMDLSYFTVEKGTDGVNFNSIGNVSAKVNRNEKNQYQLTDNNPSIGNVYYRLRIVDQDNKITTSKILLVSGKTLTNRITILPNPVRNDAAINIESLTKGSAAINIFNSDGKLVLHQSNGVIEGTNQIMIEKANGLVNGLYLVQVSVGTSRMITRMVVSK